MALSAVENVFPPVPADTAVALGAFLARRGEISVVPLGILCWAANTATAAWTYFFARSHGAAFFKEGWGRRILPPAAMTALQEAYAKYGVAAIFLSRFLPGVRAAVTPFAGVVGMLGGASARSGRARLRRLVRLPRDRRLRDRGELGGGEGARGRRQPRPRHRRRGRGRPRRDLAPAAAQWFRRTLTRA